MSKSTNLVYRTIQVEKKKTVSDLLKELNINNNFFAILVNGKKAEIDQILLPKDKIIVLPKIKGGNSVLL